MAEKTFTTPNQPPIQEEGLLSVVLPEIFDIETEDQRGWPSQVFDEQLTETKPERVLITGGHFMVGPCRLDNGKIVLLPMIFTDIPINARMDEDGQSIEATYEIPKRSPKGEWTLAQVKKTFPMSDVESGKTPAVVAERVMHSDEALQKFRQALASDPSIGAYPIYTMIQSLDCYQRAAQAKIETKHLVIVNDWQKVGSETSAGAEVARKNFWKNFVSADLISYQEIARDMGLDMTSFDAVSEQKLRNGIGRFFKKMTKKAGKKSKEGIYGFHDQTSGEDLRFGVCGAGACNSEVMELMDRCVMGNLSREGEGVLVANFVPWVCKGFVNNGVKYGLKFSMIRGRSSKRPISENISVLNFAALGMGMDTALARLNESAHTTGEDQVREMYSLIIP